MGLSKHDGPLPEQMTGGHLRLYVVRVIREAYVLAADKAGAEEQAAHVSVCEMPIIEVGSGADSLDGWEDHSLVYNDYGHDITLAQARQRFPAA